MTGKPWRALVDARVDAESHPYTSRTGGEAGTANYDADLQPEGLAVNAGYVDGYAGGEKIVTVPWAELRSFLSEQGSRVVDSLGHRLDDGGERIPLPARSTSLDRGAR